MRLAGLQKVAFLADYTKCSAFATVHESCHDPHATSRNVISGSRAAAKCRNARLSRRHLRPLHYGLMLAALITLPHFSVSSRMNFANSAGELGNTSAPRSASRALSTSVDFFVDLFDGLGSRPRGYADALPGH